MSKTMYTISFDKTRKSEKLIRAFLLNNSDTLRLTEHQWTEIKLFKIKKHGGERDEKFISTLNYLRAFFIKTIVNNKKYNDVSQFKNSKFTHYFFKLSPKLKTSLNTETLIWDAMFSKRFYGFEDPTFYKNDVMIGSVITHEPIIILYLTATEKSVLEKNGAFFD